MVRRWTEDEIAFLKRKYNGTNASELAEVLNWTPRSVKSKASSLGIVERGVWTSQDDAFLRENYLTLGAKECAKRLGRSLSAVHTRIREIGGGRASIGPRVDWTKEELDYLRENYQTKSLDELTATLGRTKNAVLVRGQMLGVRRYIDPFQFFNTWTEESAYIIGFFATDGNAHKRGPESIRISFAQKEPEILFHLQKTIVGGRITGKKSGLYELYIQSVRIYERLCEIFGQDVCRKSLTLSWPQIPIGYMKHFIRGAMDGDGSLMRRGDNLWEMSFTSGSKAFIDGFAKTILEMTGIKVGVGINKLNIYHARCSGLKAVCLASWLYKDCKIALDRKEWIAREMYNTLGGVAYSDGITPKMHEMFPDILSIYRIVG